MRKIRFDIKSVPFALLFFCVISFGLLIPWLGFYWDDWPAIWYLHVFGPSGFGAVFAVDRPLLGALFTLTTPWLGTSAVGWQIFGIITRWLSVLAFWWFMRGLWPDNPAQTTLTALLFAVYPGFKQQYISVTYSHVWIVTAVFLLSLATMSWGFRKRAFFWPLMVSSWALSALALFSIEYYFGLELLRPFIIYILVSENIKSFSARLKRTVYYWIPYILITAGFLVWRFFLYQTTRGHVQAVEKIGANPLGAVIDLVETAFVDIVNAGLAAWVQIIDFARMTSFGRGPTLLYLASAILATLAAVFYLLRLQPLSDDAGRRYSSKNWSKQAIALGAIGLCLSGIPFWSTNLPIGLEFPWDRFTLAMMFGSCLLLVGLINWLTHTTLQKAVVFGVIIGLASAMHIQYGNLYRREWNSQSQFFWQLVWRAPDIASDTLILTAELPFVYFSDNSLTAPLNWTYAPNLNSKEMPYLLYAAEARHEESLPSFKPDIPIYQPYRATEFNGTTSQALVLFYTPPGCLKIVDPTTDKRMPQKPNLISDMMPLSKLDLIHTYQNPPARPPEEIFGREPDKQWCYYFEQAEKARQSKDWNQVANLGDQALQLDQQLYEVNAPELVTYIEGYAHTGRWEAAIQLTDQSLQLSDRMDRMLCDTWQRLGSELASDLGYSSAMDSTKNILICLQ